MFRPSVSIQIPQKNSADNVMEYCLKQNFFNPNKFSPPNNWNERLKQRLASSYERNQSSILFTKYDTRYLSFDSRV